MKASRAIKSPFSNPNPFDPLTADSDDDATGEDHEGDMGTTEGSDASLVVGTACCHRGSLQAPVGANHFLLAQKVVIKVPFRDHLSRLYAVRNGNSQER